MDMFTVTEDVYHDYGVLTLRAPNLLVTEDYDLTPEDYARALRVLVEQHIASVLADAI